MKKTEKNQKYIYIYGEKNHKQNTFYVENSNEFFEKLRTTTPMGFFCSNQEELISRLKWLFIPREKEVVTDEHLLELMAAKGVLEIKEVFNEYAH